MEKILCSKCVMDNIEYPEIKFDADGVCDICMINKSSIEHSISSIFDGNEKINSLLQRIKSHKRAGKYDCLIGVSGGIDSTYLAWLCKEWGLNPLVIHVDGGWNTELSVSNINNTINSLGFDLYTKVLDWNQIRSAQKAFMKANVLDIDLPFDNAAWAVIYKVAARERIKFVLTGHNVATEGFLPATYTHYKLDSLNLKYIYSKFSDVNLRNFPVWGPVERYYYFNIKKIETHTPLNFIPFNKDEAKLLMAEKLNWKDYGNKHYENIFTRFYQGYILPEKFKVDKRKPHFSSMIASGQMTRDQALLLLKNEGPYKDANILKDDLEYFIKKMQMTPEEFNDYIQAKPELHTAYASWINVFNKLRRIKKNLFR
jgi:N-acetyl sugar amidotransferase